MTSKPFYRSSTVWINVATLVVMVLPLVTTIPAISQNQDAIAIIAAIINILNRFRTNTAVTLS